MKAQHITAQHPARQAVSSFWTVMPLSIVPCRAMSYVGMVFLSGVPTLTPDPFVGSASASLSKP